MGDVMKLLLNIGGFGLIYLGANSLNIVDYFIVIVGALCVFGYGLLSS